RCLPACIFSPLPYQPSEYLPDLMSAIPHLRITSCLLLGFAVLAQAQAGQRAAWPTAAASQHSRTNRHQLNQAWLYEQRASRLGYIPRDARAKALQQIQ